MKYKTLLWISTLILLSLYSIQTFSHLLSVSGVPVYFSVLFLILLGLLCWTSNLWILNKSGIQTHRLLSLRKGTDSSPLSPPSSNNNNNNNGLLSPTLGTPPSQINLLSNNNNNSHSLPELTTLIETKRLCTLFLSLATLSMGSFYLFLHWSAKEGQNEEKAEFIPFWTYIILLGWLMNPFQVFFYKERMEFWRYIYIYFFWNWNDLRKNYYILIIHLRIHNRSLNRIALGGWKDPVPFCDVIFADIMTSFSRVFGDLRFVVSDLVFTEEEGQLSVQRDTWIEIVVPLLIRYT